MTKNIIIGILVLVTMMSLVHASFQSTEADKQRLAAEANLVLAVEARKQADINAEAARKAEIEAKNEPILAEKARALAEVARADAEEKRKQAAEAQKRAQIAEEALKKCKGRK